MPEEPVDNRRIVAWRTHHILLVMLAAAGVLVGLALVASKTGANSLDVQVTRSLQSMQQPAFAALMSAVSWPGYFPQSWLLPSLAAAAFAWRALWPEALWVLGTQSAALITALVKGVVDRPRPSPDLVSVAVPLSDPSFPSGHVVQYATLFGFVFFLVYVLQRRSTRRTVILGLLAVPIALVGPSRLYLGQHWLSDVLGGYAMAALLLVPYCWAYATWRLAHWRDPVVTASGVHGPR